MGISQSKDSAYEAEGLNHPKMKHVKITKNREIMNVSMGIEDETQFYKWENKLSKLKKFDEYYLLLPKAYEFSKKGVCGSSGLLNVEYDNYPYLLHQEIQKRAQATNYFNETQLWYLLYGLVSAANIFREVGTKVGDIQAKNIFLNEEGQIKISNVCSWPGERTNYQKLIFEQIITYVSPEELCFSGEGRIDIYKNVPSVGSKVINTTNKDKINKVDQYLCQSFSIGLTMLQATLLKKSSSLYSQKILDKQQLNRRIVQLLRNEGKTKYSKTLRMAIASLCEIDPNDRLEACLLYQHLKYHDSQIVNLKPCSIEQIKCNNKAKYEQIINYNINLNTNNNNNNNNSSQDNNNNSSNNNNSNNNSNNINQNNSNNNNSSNQNYNNIGTNSSSNQNNSLNINSNYNWNNFANNYSNSWNMNSTAVTNYSNYAYPYSTNLTNYQAFTNSLGSTSYGYPYSYRRQQVAHIPTTYGSILQPRDKTPELRPTTYSPPPRSFNHYTTYNTTHPNQYPYNTTLPNPNPNSSTNSGNGNNGNNGNNIRSNRAQLNIKTTLQITRPPNITKQSGSQQIGSGNSYLHSIYSSQSAQLTPTFNADINLANTIANSANITKANSNTNTNTNTNNNKNTNASSNTNNSNNTNTTNTNTNNMADRGNSTVHQLAGRRIQNTPNNTTPISYHTSMNTNISAYPNAFANISNAPAYSSNTHAYPNQDIEPNFLLTTSKPKPTEQQRQKQINLNNTNNKGYNFSNISSIPKQQYQSANKHTNNTNIAAFTPSRIQLGNTHNKNTNNNNNTNTNNNEDSGLDLLKKINQEIMSSQSKFATVSQ